MDLYTDEVLDHNEHPRNYGEIEADPSASPGQVLTDRDSNASCGDMVQMYLKIEGGKIADVKWKGIGCAITNASASMLSEWIKGKSVSEIKKLGEDGLVKKIVFEVNPGREKCLTLPVRVVMKVVGTRSPKT